MPAAYDVLGCENFGRSRKSVHGVGEGAADRRDPRGGAGLERRAGIRLGLSPDCMRNTRPRAATLSDVGHFRIRALLWLSCGRWGRGSEFAGSWQIEKPVSGTVPGCNRSVGPCSRPVRPFVRCVRATILCKFRPFTITDWPGRHGSTEGLPRLGQESSGRRSGDPERGLALQFNRFRNSYGAESMGRKTTLIQGIVISRHLCVGSDHAPRSR